MITTAWRIFEYNFQSGLFEKPVTILAPNNQIRVPMKSTRTVETLIDGSLAFNKPENNYVKDIIKFTWQFSRTNEIKSLIQGYLKNDKAVKIEINPESSSYDADFYGAADQSIQGYFLNADPEWLIGIQGNTQYYQFSADFQPFNVG